MSFSDDFRDTNYSRPGPSKGKTFGPAGGPPCPTCGSRNTAVVDSRPIEGGQRRRRSCLETDKCVRWNTYETNVDPAEFRQAKLSNMDQNRVLRILETTEALRRSLKIDK